MNEPITATDDDPAISGWSIEELNLARFVAYTYPDYSFVRQHLRDFTPAEREALREERERFLSNPVVRRILAGEAGEQM